MGNRSRIKCAHCKRPIRNHEPDVVLRDLDDNGGRDRYFHTSCGAAAYAAAQNPSAYVLTVRHVPAVAN
jgi:hypothetical protein